MKINTRNMMGACSLLLLVSLYADTPQKKPQTPPKDPEEVIYNWSRTFAEVMQHANKKHYKISELEECFIKSIDAFLNNLDPHSSFLDPKTYNSMMEMTTGEFFGIGIIIDATRSKKDKMLTIVDVIPDGPSDKAGLKPFDKIVEIDGKVLEGMETEEATRILKGKRGTKARLKVMRDNHPDLIEVHITRDVIKDQSTLSLYLKNHDMYYLALNTFSANAVKAMEKLIEKAHQKPYRGLIIDLRNNSGGLLNAAVDIASLFVGKGSLVAVTKDKNQTVTASYSTNKEPICNTNMPIFILINNYTASAAEILAGCLKIHSDKLAKAAGTKDQKSLMVFIVGTKSFGKGSVQEVIPVSNNSAIKLTTSLYFLDNDTMIQGVGVEPDFLVEKRFPPTKQMVWFEKHYGRERNMRGSINGKKSIKDEDTESESPTDDEEDEEKDKKLTWAQRAKKMLNKDNQFRECITLINLLHTAKTSCPQLVNNRTSAVKFLKNNYLTDDVLEMEEVKV